MKWLILGGDGQLGKAMSVELAKKNIEFKSLSKFQLDITKTQDVVNCFGIERPNIVLNAAAWTNVDLAETYPSQAKLVNTTAPGVLAKECSKIGAKLFHISTDYVFSGDRQTPWFEDDQVCPNSVYGKTKADGEKIVLEEYSRGVYVIRTAWLYSKWGDNFVKKMLRAALLGSENISVVNDQFGQPTWALDLAAQINEMAIRNIPSGIYHGTNAGQATWFDLAKESFELVGADTNRITPVNSEAYIHLAKRPRYTVLSHNKWVDVNMVPLQEWHQSLKFAIYDIAKSIK